MIKNHNHVDIEVFKFFCQPQFEERLFISIKMIDRAAKYGNLELVEYLHTNRTEGCTTNAMDNAGSLAVLEYLHTNRSEGCTVRAMENAAAKGCSELAMDIAAVHSGGSKQQILQFLAENRSEGFSNQFIAYAAQYNNLYARSLLQPEHLVKWHGALQEAIEYGQTEWVQYTIDLGIKEIIDISKEEYIRSFWNACSACQHGYMSIIRYLVDNNDRPDLGSQKKIVKEAIKESRLSIVKYFVDQHGYALPDLKNQSLNISVSMVNYLIQHGVPKYRFLPHAIRLGILSMFQELFPSLFDQGESQTRDESDIKLTKLLMCCLRFKRLDIIEYICQHPLAIELMNDKDYGKTEGYTAYAMDLAAAKGDLSVVKYLHFNRTEGCTSNAMDQAAAKGDLSIVEFLHFNRTEGCTSNAMDKAAKCGNIKVMEFLHTHRTEGCTFNALQEAISNNNLHIVQFIHRHYPDIFNTDDNICDAILSASRLNCTDMLQYLKDNIAPSRFNCQSIMDQRLPLKLVKFLHDNLTDGWTTRAMDMAAEEGNLPLVKFLHTNRSEGCTTFAMDRAAQTGNMSMVKFLHSNRTEGCTTRAMDKAAGNGRMSIVKFLHYNRSEGCTTDAMDNAAKENGQGAPDYPEELEVGHIFIHLQRIPL
eukprot:gene2603-2989_t